jgi:hypothetical protein
MFSSWFLSLGRKAGKKLRVYPRRSGNSGNTSFWELFQLKGSQSPVILLLSGTNMQNTCYHHSLRESGNRLVFLQVVLGTAASTGDDIPCEVEDNRFMGDSPFCFHTPLPEPLLRYNLLSCLSRGKTSAKGLEPSAFAAPSPSGLRNSGVHHT